MARKSIIFCAFVLILVSAFPPKAVHADVAPPETVPGSNLSPGEESTQVRMMAETVTLAISEDPVDEFGLIVQTQAVFTMRNLGTVEERMAVRFPLSFLNGASDGFYNYPEIPSIAVKVNGENVRSRRENQTFDGSDGLFRERDITPWAVFDVIFPPDQDVIIEVAYSVDGYGWDSFPYKSFKYVLETGAGWNGTIGSAEVIVHFPYEISEKNFDFVGQYGLGITTPNGVITGNDIRWTYKELEPTSWEDNIHIITVIPSAWKKILREIEIVAKNPNDGEAWGRLAKGYKDVLQVPKGWMREDPGGLELYALSKDAYEKCLAILPDDSLWHYGYAELLWIYYQYNFHWAGKNDNEGILSMMLIELRTAIAIDPNNQQAKELLIDVSYEVPDAVRVEGDTFVFLGLTATPWAVVETPTFAPAVTYPSPTYSMGVNTPEPVSAPTSLCGSAFLLPVLFGMVLAMKRKSA